MVMHLAYIARFERFHFAPPRREEDTGTRRQRIDTPVTGLRKRDKTGARHSGDSSFGTEGSEKLGDDQVGEGATGWSHCGSEAGDSGFLQPTAVGAAPPILVHPWRRPPRLSTLRRVS